MQQEQPSASLKLEQVVIKALYDQKITCDELKPKPIKPLDLENEYQLLNHDKLYNFLKDHLFTSCEANVFVLAIKGFSNEGIAERLAVSKNTVRFHLKSIYRKTATRGRTALIRLGVELGL